MKLYEYEAKEIFSKYGMATPKGELASSPEQAREIAAELGIPVVIKAQVLVSSRGKAGGILFAGSPSETESLAERVLNRRIRAAKVQSVLIEEKLAIRKELYFGITTDRSSQSYVAIASTEGGIEIEEVAANMPEKITKVSIDSLCGFRSHHARQIVKKLGYAGNQLRDLTRIFIQLYKAAMNCDAELAEINPLVETVDGTFVVADARLLVDDNALHRHPEFRKRLLQEKTELSSQETEAHRSGLAYVKLDGNIGVIGNGAGLVMATLDVIQLYGGNPANFLDVGGGASADRMTMALDIVLSDPKVQIVLINILGGITRCDEIAKGIVDAVKRTDFKKPIVIRLVGTNEEEGRRILAEASIHVQNSMEKAASRAVEIVKLGG